MTECYEHFLIKVSGTSTPINNAKVARAGLYHSISNEDGIAWIKGTKGQTYLVTVSHPNFKTRSANITWGCNPNTHWSFPLLPKDPTPEKCKQLFLVKDAKTLRPISGVRVSGQNKIDTTDSNGYAELEAGQNSKATVAFEKDGYQRRFVTFIWICSHAHVVKMVSTAPPPDTQIRIVMSTPSRAKVYLDGSYKGEATTSPMFIKVSVGQHTVKLTATGYQDEIFQGHVSSGETKDLKISMTAEGNGGAIPTELIWSGTLKTSVGIGEAATYEFVLKETEGRWHSVLSNATIKLLVNGSVASAYKQTDADGKVSLTHKFDAPGDHTVRGWFKTSGDYAESHSTLKTINVTAPESAYVVTARNLPAGKTYTVKAYEGTSRYWDPAKEYSVTALNDTCEILRSDMTTPRVGRTIRLYDENGKQVYETPEAIRALKSTNDRLTVYVDARGGNEYRINMSHTPNTPAMNKAFDIEARLIIGQSTPAGAGQSIIFKEEVAEGQYDKIGTKDTNDFGIATYRHPGKAEEGKYNFIATFEHGETSCDAHTVTVGKKPSEIEGFLEPIFTWVQEAFNVDPETAKTYTYVGIGILGLAFLGKILSGGGGK